MSNTSEQFHVPPRTPEQRARDKEIHQRYTGRKVTMEELLGDLEHMTTMGEWYEAHIAMVELKTMREQRGLSTADIACLAGVSEDRIKALEAGNVTGSHLDTLTEYAHALGKRVLVQLA